ncbi:MAG: hypothetical protein JKY30_08700 [Flavobacteriales bacterium]|nr:hypothetical protein [Flavobacteriales bacterium]
MKKLLTLLSIFTFIFFITSCGGEEPTDEIIDDVVEETFIDDASAEETAADTSSTGVYQEEVVEGETSLQDAMKADTETEIEEGGMSFCDCVKKNKKLSDTMMSDDVSDADFDKAMEELEAMKTGECKIMFPDQSNIDEVTAHKRKVKRCLAK